VSAGSTQLDRSRGSVWRRVDRRRRLARSVIVGLILAYLAILLIVPFVSIAYKALSPGLGLVRETLTAPDTVHALKLTAIIAMITVVVCTTFGVIVAWVLTRQRFRGRAILNGIVDLPFAISPITVGLMAVLLFGRGGWFEPFFAARGIQMLFALPSMTLVTIFIAIPFVIREVAPVLEEVGTEEEDAARTLGASSWTSFRRVTLPNIRWGLLHGIALTAARSIGEIGAVLIVSGLLKGQTETATIYIFEAYELRKEAEGNIVALLLAAVSVLLLVAIEIFKQRKEKTKELNA
jgi:sulfate transport system permease protein